MRDAVASALPVLLTSSRDSKPQQGQKISAERESGRVRKMGCVGGGESESKGREAGASLDSSVWNYKRSVLFCIVLFLALPKIYFNKKIILLNVRFILSFIQFNLI